MSPSSTTRPSRSQTPRVQSSRTWSSSWETSSSVPPRAWNMPQPLQAALPERLVADREHLIQQQDVRLETDRHREGQPRLHARRVVLERRVEEVVHRRRTRRSRRSAPPAPCRVRPSTAAYSAMFSAPVSSGWKPAPSSITAVIRPWVSIVPAGRLVDPGDQPQHGALARAVVAQQRHRLARLDSEVEVAERERRVAHVDRPPQHPADEPLPQRARAVLVEVESLRDPSKLDRRAPPRPQTISAKTEA